MATIQDKLATNDCPEPGSKRTNIQPVLQYRSFTEKVTLRGLYIGQTAEEYEKRGRSVEEPHLPW